MNRQVEQDLAIMSKECNKIMAISMKEIEQISYDDFASLYNSIQPVVSRWTLAAADKLGFPQPNEVKLCCPSSLATWMGMYQLTDKLISFNLREMFYGDLADLKGMIIHELCHLLVRDHTKEFWTLYEQKIKEACLVDEDYNGWRKKHSICRKNPIFTLSLGSLFVIRKKFDVC